MSPHLTALGANTIVVLQYILHKDTRKPCESVVHAALRSMQMQSDDLHLLFRTDERCRALLLCVTRTFTR